MFVTSFVQKSPLKVKEDVDDPSKELKESFDSDSGEESDTGQPTYNLFNNISEPIKRLASNSPEDPTEKREKKKKIKDYCCKILV